MQAELLVLRIVHIVGAVVWAGTSLFVALFLMPALATAGPAAGPVMGALVKRKLFTIVPTTAVLMMLAGLRMMWINSMGFSASYFAATGGRTYVAGAVLALAAFTIFMAVNHPAIPRIMQMGQQLAQAPEAERGAIAAQLNALRARAGKASLASALLLTLAAVTMAIGRYI
jgi:uncharacterized membrane protein